MPRILITRVAVATLVASLFAACASVGYYQESTAKKVARVELVMAEPPSSFWMFRNGLDCSGGFDVLTKEQTASVVAGKGPALVIEAEREFAVYADLRHTSPLRYCTVMASFFPEPDARYRMTLAKEPGGCSIVLKRLVEEGGKTKETTEPSFKRRFGKPGMVSYQCVPL